jgi:hypothetical protein
MLILLCWLDRNEMLEVERLASVDDTRTIRAGAVGYAPAQPAPALPAVGSKVYYGPKNCRVFHASASQRHQSLSRPQRCKRTTMSIHSIAKPPKYIAAT